MMWPFKKKHDDALEDAKTQLAQSQKEVMQAVADLRSQLLSDVLKRDEAAQK